MNTIDVKNIKAVGLPLYEMKEMFNADGNFNNIKISLISINPGERIPKEGYGFHDGDEYSYFLSGEVYTESGNDKGIIGEGKATLIPKGEHHWCENRTDKPCTLVCVMVK